MRSKITIVHRTEKIMDRDVDTGGQERDGLYKMGN